MKININSTEAYLNGINCWNNNDYIKARYWFEMSYSNQEFRDQSLFKLLQIGLREGKYAIVRKLLEENKDNPLIELKQMYGLLENIENNFETSKKYYSQCMVDPNMQNKSLLALSKLYIQTGDNEVARKMLETLKLNKDFNIQAIYGLICLNILEQDYEYAYKLLKTIDKGKLTPKLLSHYYSLNRHLLYYMGKLNTNDHSYTANRFFDNSEETLLKHLHQHLNQVDKDSDGCFFKYTDLRKLLYDARDIINGLNSNHFELSDMYRFRLDAPIGFKGNVVTSDLCVVTTIGTKDIITMYPVLLSEQFDKEGMGTSKQLMLKRNQGGIRK